MKQKDFEQHVSMLLRDLPQGTTADLSDFAVAWWNGHDVTFAFLREDGDEIDAEFDLNDFVWNEWEPTFATWAAAPKFSVRDEVLDWMKDAPPFEAG